MVFLRVLLFSFLVILLSGCSAFGPSAETLNISGPSVRYSTNLTGADDQLKGISEGLPRTQYAAFERAYDVAFRAQYLAYSDAPDPAAQDKYRLMAAAGFGVVKANCLAFFKSRGETQLWVNVGKDTIAAGGTLATGILALAGASPLGLSIVALSTAGTYSGITIYEKNFLFSAENVEAVSALTMNALSDNATKVQTSPGNWDFYFASNAIVANQELCRPASILALAREAIKGGKIQSVQSSADAAGQLDSILKQLIGLIAGLDSGSTPSDTQVVALCWAADSSIAKSAADMDVINALVDKYIFPSGPAVPAKWRPSAVSTQCRNLSAATQTLIQQQIPTLQKKAKGAAGVVSLKDVEVPPSLPAATLGSTSRNFTTFAR